MLFKYVKPYTIFSYEGLLYLKTDEHWAINENSRVVNFCTSFEVIPVTKTFKITFEDLVDTIDKGKQFEYNGTMYLRIPGHRQALNLTTYCVETFI